MSLSAKILIGLALGIAFGIFFGELVTPIGVVGDAFILLLQMTVLPYVAVSLIAALGSLRYDEARALGRNAGGFLLAFWAIGLLVVALTPFAFPAWESASFFSSALVEERKTIDFLNLFIPSNPFHSLAESVVPAVVVFSACLGLALIGVERKDAIVRALGVLTDAIGRITTGIMRLAPFGVFAIAAKAAGTLQPDVLSGLRVYVVVTVANALLLTFWTLPVLVTTLTPIRYRQIFRGTRDVLVTAFATGVLFVVLTLLAERIKELLRTAAHEEEETALVDVVVPAAYNVPSVGKLLTLGFVLFAGWLTGFSLSPGEYPALLGAGLVSLFGSTLVAIPFLLDLFRVPADTFELFVMADNVIVARFNTLLAAMFLTSLPLLTAAAAAGRIELRTPKLLVYAGLTVLFTVGTIGGVRLTFEAIGSQYQGYQKFIERDFLLPPAPVSLYASPAELPVDPTGRGPDGESSALDRIVRRGSLRVGYRRDHLPYAFRNTNSELVGFDAELLHRLAADLGVKLEFVLVELGEIPDLLASGVIDTATGVAVTPERMQQLAFPDPHIDETLAFIVRDHDRNRFNTRKAIQSQEELHIAVPDAPYYVEKVRNYLPDARLTVLESPRAYFTAKEGTFDALVYGAAAGSAWSLVYPAFTVAVPHPDILAVPMAFPVARGDQQMVDFLSRWVELKRKDRTIQRLFDYWIEGVEPTERKRRWSVVRDILGWVD
ncbi:MAG: cation:dicarboxylase symporter family transporter [Gemmatimonadetes bacterium]|nr:cation:dicarboxylase symporter family transporter [Gemmatimonadota bacterium]